MKAVPEKTAVQTPASAPGVEESCSKCSGKGHLGDGWIGNAWNNTKCGVCLGAGKPTEAAKTVARMLAQATLDKKVPAALPSWMRDSDSDDPWSRMGRRRYDGGYGMACANMLLAQSGCTVFSKTTKKGLDSTELTS